MSNFDNVQMQTDAMINQARMQGLGMEMQADAQMRQDIGHLGDALQQQHQQRQQMAQQQEQFDMQMQLREHESASRMRLQESEMERQQNLTKLQDSRFLMEAEQHKTAMHTGKLQLEAMKLDLADRKKRTSGEYESKEYQKKFYSSRAGQVYAASQGKVWDVETQNLVDDPEGAKQFLSTDVQSRQVDVAEQQVSQQEKRLEAETKLTEAEIELKKQGLRIRQEEADIRQQINSANSEIAKTELKIRQEELAHKNKVHTQEIKARVLQQQIDKGRLDLAVKTAEQNYGLKVNEQTIQTDQFQKTLKLRQAQQNIEALQFGQGLSLKRDELRSQNQYRSLQLGQTQQGLEQSQQQIDARIADAKEGRSQSQERIDSERQRLIQADTAAARSHMHEQTKLWNTTLSNVNEIVFDPLGSMTMSIDERVGLLESLGATATTPQQQQVINTLVKSIRTADDQSNERAVKTFSNSSGGENAVLPAQEPPTRRRGRHGRKKESAFFELDIRSYPDFRVSGAGMMQTSVEVQKLVKSGYKLSSLPEESRVPGNPTLHLAWYKAEGSKARKALQAAVQKNQGVSLSDEAAHAEISDMLKSRNPALMQQMMKWYVANQSR